MRRTRAPNSEEATHWVFDHLNSSFGSEFLASRYDKPSYQHKFSQVLFKLDEARIGFSRAVVHQTSGRQMGRKKKMKHACFVFALSTSSAPGSKITALARNRHSELSG